MQDVGDERIKIILEKYVVKPQLTHRKETVANNMEKTLKLVTSFIGSYYEALQVFNQKQKEQQMLDSLRSQQTKQAASN